MTKPSTYLYASCLKEIYDIPYHKALLTKMKLAKSLLHDLVHIDNMSDPSRMNHVANAIKHNRDLLLELGLSSKDISSLLDDKATN